MFGFFKRSQAGIKDTYQLLQSLGLGESTASGKTVNPESAQALPAVYCAVSTIADSVASLPVHVYLKTADGEKVRQESHHIEKLLNYVPNEYQTAYDFKIALMRSVLLQGNGYALIDYNGGGGQVTALHWLHPSSVIIQRLSTGRLGYQVTLNTGTVVNCLQEEILHIRFHSDDGIVGKSPVQVCRESIGLGLAQQEHGAAQYKNGVRPSGVLSTDAVFKNPEAISRLKDELRQQYVGSANNGKIMILENGLKWQPISLSNIDAEWLNSRNFTVADIARMFKLSPIFLMDYTHCTYSNFGEAQRAFLSQSLRPWLTNLRMAFQSRLVSERNQSKHFIDFETKDLLRATAEERFNVYDVAIRNGVMNPNECRKAENLPARAGGDEYSQSWIQKGQAEGMGDAS